MYILFLEFANLSNSTIFSFLSIDRKSVSVKLNSEICENRSSPDSITLRFDSFTPLTTKLYQV